METDSQKGFSNYLYLQRVATIQGLSRYCKQAADQLTND